MLRPLAFCLILVAGPAFAQHAGHSMPAPPVAPAAPAAAPAATADAPSTTALRAAMAAMHKDMDIAYTGDADVDFARGMIPHHQGAIDMAKAELRYGKDRRLRKLARDIVKAQEKEIAVMKAFLARKGATR